MLQTDALQLVPLSSAARGVALSFSQVIFLQTLLQLLGRICSLSRKGSSAFSLERSPLSSESCQTSKLHLLLFQ